MNENIAVASVATCENLVATEKTSIISTVATVATVATYCITYKEGVERSYISPLLSYNTRNGGYGSYANDINNLGSYRGRNVATLRWEQGWCGAAQVAEWKRQLGVET